MEEKEIDMNNRCYLLIIRALCKGGYLEQVPPYLTQFVSYYYDKILVIFWIIILVVMSSLRIG